MTYHPKGERVCNCEGVKGIPVFEVAGRRMELEMLDVEYIHHEKSVRRSTSGMYFESIFLTKTTDEGINLQWSVSYKLPYGILGTLMDMISFSKEMDKHMVRSLDNIRNALEQKVVN